MIPFHAQFLTKFTRHAYFKQNFTNHEIQPKSIEAVQLLPYPLPLKQRCQETIFICPERGCGSRFIIANTAIIKCLFHDVVN